jgi:hypothetical protein
MKLDRSILENRRVLLAIIVVVVVIVAAAAFALMGGDGGGGNGNGNGDDKPVRAEAGPDVHGEAGQPLHFNASNSTGPIVQYWWDFDSANNSEPLVHEADGVAAVHTYEEPGVYMVTLVVERKDGQNDTDFLSAYVDYNYTDHGTVSLTHMSDNITVPVKLQATRIVLTLTFKTKTTGSEVIPNNVDMFVYIEGDTPSYSTVPQVVNPQQDKQTKTLDVPTGTIATKGGFKLEIRYTTTGLPRNIDYDLHVLVSYMP